MFKKIFYYLLLTISLWAKPSLFSGNVKEKFPPLNQTQFDKTAWTVDHDLFVLHSIPKCGTHFIKKILLLMTGKESKTGPMIFEHLVWACKNNCIAKTEKPYTRKTRSNLFLYQHKAIAMVRDPRDALISLLFYMKKFADGTGGPKYRDFFTIGPDWDFLPLDQQITALIKGQGETQSYIKLYNSLLGWAFNSNNLMIRYEDLVGSQGGGDDVLQRAEIKRIADFIHLSLIQAQLNDVIDNMYRAGRSAEEEGKTFVRASIGNWRTFLNEEHKNLIKKMIGKELIQLGYEQDLNW